MSRIAYVNGRYVPHRDAMVHIEDRGYHAVCWYQREFVAPALGVVAAYSADEFRRLMLTGEPIGDRRLGIMRLRAQQSLSHLTDAEVNALYEYLRALGSR